MLPNIDFDRDLSIHDVLEKVEGEKLVKSLSLLAQQPLILLDEKRNKLIGDTVLTDDMLVQPIVLEIEPIAYIAGKKQAENTLLYAGTLLAMVLRNAARYIMTSDLHLQAIQEDYAQLNEKHSALQNSETQYRELSENLEQRVAEQVTTLESAQRQLYQAEKMASVGQLAAGVAHEINNPIGFIQSNLHTANDYVAVFTRFKQCLLEEDSATCFRKVWEKEDVNFILEDFATLLAESIDGANRVTTIVKNLKDFSNVDATEFSNASPDDIIKNVVSVAEFEIHDQKQVLLELGGVPFIRCQAGNLAQVFMNLLLNALNVIDEDGRILIRTCIDDGKLRIDVNDTGPGIPADVIERVFDPFFTTHDVGEGTGLGLTVSRDIVHAHKGEINISSEPGKGTSVSILLPMSGARVPAGT